MEKLPVMMVDAGFVGLDWRGGLGLLPRWRQEGVLRLRQECDRRAAVAVWLLLRRCCRELLGLAEVPAVAHTASGKPFFPSLPGVHFGLSHCRVAVACAMAHEPIGIDVEAVSPLDVDVARHVLSDDELGHVLADGCPPLAFTRLWTMKESLLKLTGEGIGGDLRPLLGGVDPARFRTTVDGRGRWVCTACTVTPWA